MLASMSDTEKFSHYQNFFLWHLKIIVNHLVLTYISIILKLITGVCHINTVYTLCDN